MFEPIVRHFRIVGALIMREMATRFGREGLGFAWVVGEPLIFCFGVLVLWGVTKPAYEHGVRVAPFVMTGYMCLILSRHMIGLLGGALQANLGLLYHRQIAPLHIFGARILLELGGATAAFFIVYLVLFCLKQVDLPHDYLLLYAGWGLLAWVSCGFALILTGLAMRYETFERVVGLISYILIPVSGVFFMVAWLPPGVRELYLYVPFPHGVEMIRAAVFGEFVPTYYDPLYAMSVGAVFNILGLLLIAGARDRISVE
jgi:capsular polysaccharide transport system permease protein